MGKNILFSCLTLNPKRNIDIFFFNDIYIVQDGLATKKFCYIVNIDVDVVKENTFFCHLLYHHLI